MMNRKHTFLNCLLTVLLIVVVLVQTIPALAVDEGQAEPSATETQDGTTPNGDDGEGADTPEDESPSEGQETGITASTLEELLQAIDEAEDGALIGIACEIVCPDGTTLGNADKAVTIQRMAPEGHVIFNSGDGSGSATIQNITFDGSSVEAFYPLVESALSATFTNCSFINCIGADGAALTFSTGNNTLTGCTFDNNSGQQGAHIRINGRSATIENCKFTNATASMKAGAIACYADQKVTITGCTITGNTAAQHGGGIYNTGILNIEQSKIYGNTAGGVADDLVNEYWGRLALMDDHAALVDLYAPDGVTPNKWAVDTFTDDWGDPETYPNMIFSMTFAADDEPEPTPEPDPEPTPDPTPSEPSTSHSSGHSTTQTVTDKEITLTNQKAVLKAPEADFWTGYETGYGGAADAVTRADFAALMVPMMDSDSLKEYSANTAPFDDVEGSSPDIATAYNAGIMIGCGLGAFHPEYELTWGELITVMARFTDEESPAEVYTGDHWAKNSINTAIALGWISFSDTFDPGGAVSCGEMIDFIQTVFQWASD